MVIVLFFSAKTMLDTLKDILIHVWRGQCQIFKNKHHFFSLVIFSTGSDVPTQPKDLSPAAGRHCSLQFTVKRATAINNIQENLNNRYYVQIQTVSFEGVV